MTKTMDPRVVGGFARLALIAALAAGLRADAPRPAQADRARHPRVEPLDSRIQAIPPIQRGAKGFYPVRIPHARALPTYPDEHPRVAGRPATWGAGLPPAPKAPEPEPSPAGTLPKAGGDIQHRIRAAIRQDRATRYAKQVEGFRLLEQYRAEKAMLGLCPVDDCEEVRFVLEGRPFTPEGHCQEHAATLVGPVRLKWMNQAVAERKAHREKKMAQLRKKFVGMSGKGALACLEDTRFKYLDEDEKIALLREVFLQEKLPAGFPGPAQLGPNGTLPSLADPRDPAGWPYNAIDPTPDLETRASQGETRSWIETSLQAP